MRRSRRLTGIALVVALVALALAAHAPATAAQSSVVDYVALGDSYTAGPLIPLQETTPLGCLRSTNNYPHLVANQGGFALRDVSCSGATTEDMTQAQDVDPGPNPPQFDALDVDSELVTLGIGGNDIGFSEIARNCASLTPTGTPCQDRYVVNGRDELRERIKRVGPKVAQVIDGIHTRAPAADIFVVGYPAILPESGPGCWPSMPITPQDVPYVRGVEKALNLMLERRAEDNGATYVDIYTPSIGHDACQPPVIRWVEPVVPASPAAPVHPNLFGMQGVTPAVLAAIQAA